MDKRNFFELQNVQPEEMNGLVTTIANAIEQAGYECGGRGIIYGLRVRATDPVSMAVRVDPGAARFYNPATVNTGTNSDRKASMCRLSAETSISLAADYLGAGTAVTAGNERWVTVVIKPKTVESDPRTSPVDGSTINFIITESGELAVVAGVANTAGTATLPDVSAIGIRVADFLITNGISVAPAIDLRSREDFVQSVMGGEGTINTTGNVNGYSLIWESRRDSQSAGIMRLYLSTGGTAPTGLLLTIGASWDRVAAKWVADASPSTPTAMRLSANGVMITRRYVDGTTPGGVNNTIYWSDTADGTWGTSMLIAPTGATKTAGPEATYETAVAIAGYSARATVGLGAVPPMMQVIPFPFEIPDTRYTVATDAFENEDHSIQGGSTADAGVGSVSWYVCTKFAICKVVPTAIDTLVNYVRKVRFYPYQWQT